MVHNTRSGDMTVRVAGEADDHPRAIEVRLGRPGDAAPVRVAVADPRRRQDDHRIDTLVVFSPAALRHQTRDLARGGTLILDSAGFTPSALRAAGYERDPCDALRRSGLRCLAINITALVTGLSPAPSEDPDAVQPASRTLWALGLALALHDHPAAPGEAWIAARLAEASETGCKTLRAGHAFAATARIAPAWPLPAASPQGGSAGTWRSVTGALALAFGFCAGAQDLGLDPAFAAAPAGRSGTLLDAMRDLEETTGLRCVEVASAEGALAAALGASYAGAIGIAATAGADLAGVAPALGLAIAAELPLVALCIQRPGPSGALPSGTSQADLSWALDGRHGDAPCPVIAIRSPAHGFAAAREAVRLSVAHMTPVILLADAQAFDGTEAFRIPNLPPASPRTPAQALPGAFQPFLRDPRTLARPWAVPGTPGAAHRTGGLEQHETGGVISNDPANHARMIAVRRTRLALIAEREPEADLASGTADGELVLVGWGSSFAAIAEAARRLRAAGVTAAHLHLDLVAPLPRGLTALLGAFRHVLVAEANAGQLVRLLRAATLVDARPISRTDGRPLDGREIETAAWAMVKGDRT